MPPDSVIACLSEFWQSAIKQCCLQQEKSCLSVCLYMLYARKQKIIYIFLGHADTLTGCFEAWNLKKLLFYIEGTHISKYHVIWSTVEVDLLLLFFLNVTPPHPVYMAFSHPVYSNLLQHSQETNTQLKILKRLLQHTTVNVYNMWDSLKKWQPSIGNRKSTENCNTAWKSILNICLEIKNNLLKLICI